MPQDAIQHSPLAQACDRFLEVAVFWDTASVAVELEAESYDFEESIEIAEKLVHGWGVNSLLPGRYALRMLLLGNPAILLGILNSISLNLLT